jgi:hypothetical protein
MSFDGELRDICQDAVLVDSPRGCTLGAVVGLTTEILGNSGEVELTGRVIRVAPANEGRFHLAVLFTTLTPAAATQIEFFLDLQD